MPKEVLNQDDFEKDFYGSRKLCYEYGALIVKIENECGLDIREWVLQQLQDQKSSNKQQALNLRALLMFTTKNSAENLIEKRTAIAVDQYGKEWKPI